MAKWLFKSEPDAYSFDELLAKGTAGEEWTGIRNYQARNNMRKMEIGEQGFFYYSNIGKAVVGIVEVCALTHQDSTADKPAWECVDIRAIKWLPRHVSLDEIKREDALRNMVLVNNSRLSVQPVSDEEWVYILGMAGKKV